MDEEERKELVEQRKRELRQKELENDIKRDMRVTFQRLRVEEQIEDTGDPFTAAVIRFSVTIVVLYVIYLWIYFLLVYIVSQIGSVLPSWAGPVLYGVNPVFQALIWIASIYSVYRKKSVIDDIIDFFV